MTRDATVSKALDVRLSALDIADAFCQLDDDGQARFFVEVARIMDAWTTVAGADMQRAAIARHLLECECSSSEARYWIRDLAANLDEGARQ